MSNRQNLLNGIKKYLEGGIAKHTDNIEVYLNQSVGIGEHSDIVETLEKELEHLSSFDDKLNVLDKYFTGMESGTKELLNERT